MRIISGKYKGKHLRAPKNNSIRPTTDFAKEALFNILNNRFYFDNLSVLDLCCGIGSISFEFASRGCTDITAVDQQNSTLRFINSTAKDLDFNIKTVKSDMFKYLEKTTEHFDVIFCDPPYRFTDEQFKSIVKNTFDRKILNTESLLIIEHSKHTELSELSHFENSKKYGDSKFSFFSNEI